MHAHAPVAGFDIQRQPARPAVGPAAAGRAGIEHPGHGRLVDHAPVAVPAYDGADIGPFAPQALVALFRRPPVAVCHNKLPAGQIEYPEDRPRRIGGVVVAVNDGRIGAQPRKLSGHVRPHITGMHDQSRIGDRRSYARIEHTMGIGNQRNTHAVDGLC